MHACAHTAYAHTYTPYFHISLDIITASLDYKPGA